MVLVKRIVRILFYSGIALPIVFEIIKVIILSQYSLEDSLSIGYWLKPVVIITTLIFIFMGFYLVKKENKNRVLYLWLFLYFLFGIYIIYQ